MPEDDEGTSPSNYKLSYDVIVFVLAEILGTANLMFFGCLGCAPKIYRGQFIPQWAGFAFGMAVALSVQVFAPISGGHFNPAVTLGVLILGKLNIVLAPFYFLAQIIGALLGYGLLLLLMPSEFTNDLCVTAPVDELHLAQAVFIELVATALLVLTVASLMDKRYYADAMPVRIAIALGAIIVTVAPLTGASINPARTLAPAIMQNSWRAHWIYWVGPLAGGAVGAAIYRFCFEEGLANL